MAIDRPVASLSRIILRIGPVGRQAARAAVLIMASVAVIASSACDSPSAPLESAQASITVGTPYVEDEAGPVPTLLARNPSQKAVSMLGLYSFLQDVLAEAATCSCEDSAGVRASYRF